MPETMIFNLVSVTAIDAIAILLARKIAPGNTWYCVYVALFWGLTVAMIIL